MSSKRTILLIDYDPQSIQKTRTPLQRAGYRVEVAGDGVSGLEAFDKLVPDLVLIEPMVPKKHGFQVCQQIKSTARGKRTPVLITTAFYKGRKHRLEAQQKYGCDGYLEKPIAEDLLLSTCRQFLIDLPEQATAPPDLAAPAAGEPAVISFPDLPLGDERQPAPLAALDDLSDDEIQARLDRMILEDDPAPAPPAPTPARAQAPEVLPSPVEPPPPPQLEVEPPKPALEPPDATLPRQPQRARPAALDRQRPRAAQDLAPRRRSRLPLWIGVAAALCLGAGAALLWLLPETGSASEVGNTTAESRRQPAPVVPAPLPHPEEIAEQPAPVAAESSPAPEPTSAAALVEPAPIRIEKPPQAEPPRAPSRPTPQPVQAVQSDSKPAPAALPPAAEPAAAERTAEPPAAEPATGEVVEALEPQPQASVETEVESPAPAAVLPREGDLLPLAEVDRAPRPKLKPPPEYPRAARELRQEGTVVLRVLVSETGAVEQVEVESGTNFRPLREEAVRAVRGWRYEPALEQGVRVRVWIVEQVTFEL